MTFNYMYIFYLIILNIVQIIEPENKTDSLTPKEGLKTKSISRKISTHLQKKNKHHHKISDSRKKGEVDTNITSNKILFSIDILEDQINKPENISVITLKRNDTIKSSKTIEMKSDVIEMIEKPVLLLNEHKSQEEVKKFKEERKNNDIEGVIRVNFTDLSIIKKENTSNNNISNEKDTTDLKNESENNHNTLKFKDKLLKENLLNVEVMVINNKTTNNFKKLENNTKELENKSSNKTIDSNVEVIFPIKIVESSNDTLLKSINSTSDNKIKIVDFEKSSNKSTIKSNESSNNATTLKTTFHNIFLSNNSSEKFNISSSEIFNNISVNETKINSTKIFEINDKNDTKVAVITDSTPLTSSNSSVFINKTDAIIIEKVSKSEKEKLDVINDNKNSVKNQKSTFFVVKIKGNKVIEEQAFDDENEVKKFLSKTTQLPSTTTTISTIPTTTTLITTTTTTTPTTTHPLPPTPNILTPNKITTSLIPKGMPPSAKPPNDDVIKKLNAAIDFITIAKQLGIFRID
uniref:ShKT domain-containing protein n=1 Tax=Strongyloides stercoralis TaxID=6248 RepID=A0A0K0DTG2_STRER